MSSTSEKSKDFDFEGFFTNPIVMRFIEGLVASLLDGLLKGSPLTQENKNDIKSKAITVLRNLDQFINPNFAKNLADNVSLKITSKLDELIVVMKEGAADAGKISAMIKDSVAGGVAEGMPMAIQDAFSKIEAETITKFHNKTSNGL